MSAQRRASDMRDTLERYESTTRQNGSFAGSVEDKIILHNGQLQYEPPPWMNLSQVVWVMDIDGHIHERTMIILAGTAEDLQLYVSPCRRPGIGGPREPEVLRFACPGRFGGRA